MQDLYHLLVSLLALNPILLQALRSVNGFTINLKNHFPQNPKTLNASPKLSTSVRKRGHLDINFTLKHPRPFGLLAKFLAFLGAGPEGPCLDPKSRTFLRTQQRKSLKKVGSLGSRELETEFYSLEGFKASKAL